MKRLVILFAVLVATTSISAEAIRQPPSLQAGDEYRLAFVTSTTIAAESADIETYNSFVQATANAAPIGDWGLEWKAIAGTETVSARENTSTDVTDRSVPIFLLDGTELVPSYESFWNAEAHQILRFFDVNEMGERFDSPDPPMLAVWTGSGSDGLQFYYSDTDGPLGAGIRSIIGFGDLTSSEWITATVRDHELELPMYALSEPLAAVPEPKTAAQSFVLLIVLLHVRRTRMEIQS